MTLLEKQMKNAGKVPCKCGRYFHDPKFPVCFKCWSERPLEEHLKGYKKNNNV